MAKKTGNVLTKAISLVAWLIGVIVSLAVGFALIGGTLAVPLLGVVNEVAGWIVIVATLLGVVLAIIDSLK